MGSVQTCPSLIKGKGVVKTVDNPLNSSSLLESIQLISTVKNGSRFLCRGTDGIYSLTLLTGQTLSLIPLAQQLWYHIIALITGASSWQTDNHRNETAAPNPVPSRFDSLTTDSGDRYCKLRRLHCGIFHPHQYNPNGRANRPQSGAGQKDARFVRIIATDLCFFRENTFWDIAPRENAYSKITVKPTNAPHVLYPPRRVIITKGTSLLVLFAVSRPTKAIQRPYFRQFPHKSTPIIKLTFVSICDLRPFTAFRFHRRGNSFTQKFLKSSQREKHHLLPKN